MCDCDICVEDRRRDEEETRLGFTPEQREYVRQLRDLLFSIDFNLDYYKSIVKGQWPQADAILSQHRKPVTIRLFDKLIEKAEANRPQQFKHLSGQVSTYELRKMREEFLNNQSVF